MRFADKPASDEQDVIDCILESDIQISHMDIESKSDQIGYRSDQIESNQIRISNRNTKSDERVVTVIVHTVYSCLVCCEGSLLTGQLSFVIPQVFPW